ncbi:hypothetical protein H2203_005604 [Taxawa tesnikishii (nom. ined.)]|nr:hypothetical protein H2203_005604 [Dothideales sp. JES 119]
MGTPCPQVSKTTNARFGPDNVNNAKTLMDDIFAIDGDTTTLVAQVLGEEFRNAKPELRRQTLLKKPKKNGAIGIFEDSTAQPAKEVDRVKARSLYAKPKKAKLETLKEDRVGRVVSDQESVDKGKEYGSVAQEKDGKENLESGYQEKEQKDTELDVESKRDMRRRTIWVPSDDTTIATIHPGAHTHILKDDTLGLPYWDTKELDSVIPQCTVAPVGRASPGVSKAPRKSLAAAPKRAAFSQLSRTDANIIRGDVAGSGGGKENLPPGMHPYLKRTSVRSAVPTDVKPVKAPPRQSLSPQNESSGKSRLLESTAASQARQTAAKKRPVSELREGALRTKKTTPSSTEPAKRSVAKTVRRPSIEAKSSPLPTQSQSFRAVSKAPNKLSVPAVALSTRNDTLDKYPVLPNDLSRAEMYEDSWLDHQEVALTQLINRLFEQAEGGEKDSSLGHALLRDKLLAIYQQPDTATLHRRLQASLQFGALSIAKDVQPPSLKEDVGLRWRFLDLWLKSYDLRVLQAAVEVVVGRYSATSQADAKASRKGLEQFLRTFLIRHEDAIPSSSSSASGTSCHEVEGAPAGTPVWSWRRTVLRSLMLVNLLDRAKTSGAFSGCLFQSDSAYKSSNEILHILSTMLIPSIGDVVRPLGHIEYKVTHVQHPLQEYRYHISNLAVDLRNGVVLTRLVELLLYPPTTLQTLPDSTVTIALPTGATLTSAFDLGQESAWVLSQHLKFPAAGKAQKLFNVQIALSALAGLGGLAEAAMGSVTAEDVVNGHRERTLTLLWSLVSGWGLGLLVDWKEVESETRRLTREETSDPLDDDDDLVSLDADADTDADTHSDLSAHASLLQSWASAICGPRGLPITNLSTSFASPRALEAIVDAYAAYLPPATLGGKLKSLGLSASFTTLLTHNNSSSSSTSTSINIPSRTTTISLLALLASRLLPLARTHRAVCTLQRFWRSRLRAAAVSRRIVAASLARQCQVVVSEKRRIEGAACVLQRAWRRVLAARIERLVADVLTFQCLARAWRVRRESGMRRGAVGSVRVRGGW